MMRKCTWEFGGKQKFGYFHQFGIRCSSDYEGHGVQWTTVIIEDLDGNVIEFDSSEGLCFLPDSFENNEYRQHKQKYGFEEVAGRSD